jgi:nicotinamidase-related amidase
MAVDVGAMLDPAHAAVVTSECQNGVIGATSVLPELAAAAAELVIPNGARVCAAARAVGVPVIHCTAGRRPDDRGSNRNARLFGAILRSPVRIDLGTRRPTSCRSSRSLNQTSSCRGSTA